MSKVGIVMWILGLLFVIFCFWLVGCSSDTSSGMPLCVVTNDSTSTQFSEMSPECRDDDMEMIEIR